MNLVFGLFAFLMFAGIALADNETLNGTDVGNDTLVAPLPDEGNESVSEVDLENVTDDNSSAAAANSMAIQARSENVKYGYEKTLVAMEATIEYFSNKTNVSTVVLVELKDNFTALYVGLQRYVIVNDPSGFGKNVAEMHKIAAKFKSETTKIAAPGEMKELKEAIQEKLGVFENDTSKKKIKEKAKQLKVNAYRMACGLNMIRIQKLEGNLTVQNISTEDLDSMRTQIREQCKNVSIKTNESDLGPLMQRVKDKFSEAKTKIMAKVRMANEKALENAIQVINALENKGINTSSARERLSEIQDLREEIRIVCVNATSSECSSMIKELRNGTQGLREDIKVVVRENSGGGKRNQ